PMYMRIIKLLIVVQPINSVLPEITGLDRADKEPKTSRFSKWARWLFTAPYAVLVFLFALEGANIGLLSWFSDGAGSDFGEAATGVIVACMLGVVVWNIVNTYINKNLPAAVLDPTVLMGSEGGGDEQATRIQTVLPIARNFALVIIVVVVIFSVLSSIGVNTAPLLAGAGVIGIAIGFGAQKLVQDVVSGMFFLFEDAFRIGEYIDTGSLVGTVESTSVRSLRLRHHLGAVQTIPYGEIRSVKNLSRDFVIMKLKFRVPFDTDIEVVRKTIKKVGQELLLDEELGADFIAPLKSQGVQTAEDDALVIRMKFTCKPGKQWMIKRSAYRLVQEALAEKGIQFAPRQVTVHVPEAEQVDPQVLKQAAGAAAAIAAEKEQQNKAADPLADM
ncbi:MAG: mechanosensitive ion channel family protein, partial [Proteobacteria bacterium]|nr:mechanosensitive ion channel family protein [Pseudomonadota bacterium]